MKNRITALLLALCMVLSAGLLASCKNEDEKAAGNTEESGIQKPDGELTEEEIFARVKAGVLETADYQGVFSTRYMQSQTMNQVTRSGSMKLTIDRVNLRAAFLSESLNGEESAAKLFEEGDKYYIYESESQSDYVEISKEEMNQTLLLFTEAGGSQYYTPSAVVKELCALGGVENYATLTSMYATVTADSLAALKADFGEDKFDGDVKVSAKAEKGVYSILFNAEIDSTYGDDHVIADAALYYSVKNGKLAECGYTMHFSNGGDPVAMESKIAFDYAFDTALFESIVPDGIEKPEQEYQSAYIEFYYGDRQLGVSGSSFGTGDAAAAVFAQLEEMAMYNYGPFEQGNPNSENVATYEGWYLDKECTQKLNLETLTAAELAKIDTLYAKSFVINSKYALVTGGGETVSKLSEAYRVVKENMLLGVGYGYDIEEANIAEAGTWYELSEGYDEVWVNGEKIDQNKFLVGGGTFYEITYVIYYENADCNIFGLFFPLLFR